MSFTVVPPHNLDLQADTRHMIGSWFVAFSGCLEAAAAVLSLAASIHMQSLGCVALKERGLTVPEIMLIAGTRVALGAGLGLL
jgi:hypothetical protein